MSLGIPLDPKTIVLSSLLTRTDSFITAVTQQGNRSTTDRSVHGDRNTKTVPVTVRKRKRRHAKGKDGITM